MAENLKIKLNEGEYDIKEFLLAYPETTLKITTDWGAPCTYLVFNSLPLKEVLAPVNGPHLYNLIEISKTFDKDQRAKNWASKEFLKEIEDAKKIIGFYEKQRREANEYNEELHSEYTDIVNTYYKD